MSENFKTALESSDDEMIELEIGGAVKSLLSGEKVVRRSWNGQYLMLLDDEIYMIVNGDAKKYKFMNEDILATDWIEAVNFPSSVKI